MLIILRRPFDCKKNHFSIESYYTHRIHDDGLSKGFLSFFRKTKVSEKENWSPELQLVDFIYVADGKDGVIYMKMDLTISLYHATWYLTASASISNQNSSITLNMQKVIGTEKLNIHAVSLFTSFRCCLLDLFNRVHVVNGTENDRKIELTWDKSINRIGICWRKIKVEGIDGKPVFRLSLKLYLMPL